MTPVRGRTSHTHRRFWRSPFLQSLKSTESYAVAGRKDDQESLMNEHRRQRGLQFHSSISRRSDVELVL